MNAKINTAISNSSEVCESHSQLPIVKRVVSFDYADIDGADFFSGNPVISALWVALSTTFPMGEAEFIHSVNNYRDKVTDPKLAEDMANFAAQEAHHGLQHKKMNRQFGDKGYDIKSIEVKIAEKLEEREAAWSHKKRLMRTVGAEHVTATFAHYALSQPHVLDNVPESFRHAMLWHAIEEIEHKSVAFDVYDACEGDMRSLKRHYAWFCFVEFPLQMTLMTRYLLKQKGENVTWRHRFGLLKYLFGKSGMISSVFGLYLSFFKKDFHPWQHDDSALINHWKEALKPYYREV